MRFSWGLPVLALVVGAAPIFAMDEISVNASSSLMASPWLSEVEASESQFLLDPVQAFTSYNGSEPFTGWGDGALWQGAGFNSSLQGGVRWIGPFWDINVQPLVWMSTNDPFFIPTLSSDVPVNSNPPYGDAHRGSWDHPLRMGGDSLYRWDAGQSRVKVFWGPLYTEIGTRNRIWGASRFNSILLSANGPGVPSVELGLDPWQTDWGTWEGHLIYGLLKASGLQVDNGLGGTRFWSGLFLGYSPPFASNLTLGMGRTVSSYTSQFSFGDFLIPFSTNISIGQDKYDQRISLMYRYREPSLGLELYGEWSRNDFNHTWGWWQLLLEHSQNWVLGFRKDLGSGDWGTLRAEAELGVLSMGIEYFTVSPGSSGNDFFPNGVDLYTNTYVIEGYTIEGQDLGAAAGNGNFVLGDLHWEKAEWSVGQRVIRWVKDYSKIVETFKFNATFYTDVSYLVDTTVQYKMGSWKFSGNLGTNVEFNRLFDAAGGGYNGPPLWQSWHISTGVSYQF